MINEAGKSAFGAEEFSKMPTKGLESQLVESVRTWIFQNLPHDQSDASLTSYLNGLDAHELLIRYHNWGSRFIRPQPRTVLRSAEFSRNPIALQRTHDLALLVDDIERGRDLQKYLSKNVVRNVVRAPGGRRPDLDLMLNDWRVHHLHISSQLDPDGFVKRDGPLLFCVFHPDTAYLIDIMGHGDWTREHVLQVIAREWPAAGIIRQIQVAIAGASPALTDDERAALRAKHMNATFEHDGKVYMPGGALMAAGTSFAATLDTDRIMRAIKDFAETVERDPGRLQEAFSRSGLTYPEDPKFEFAIQDDGPGIIETGSTAWINLKEWMQ
jgi:hypothetical protein